MVLQSKKVIPWTRKNYSVTIINFILHTIIMTGLAVGIIFLNAGSGGAFIEYFTDKANLRNSIYLVLFISFLNLVTYLYLYCESRDFLREAKNITLVFLVIDLSLVLSFVMGNYVGIYSRPIVLCALLVLLLINKRTALFMNFIFALIMFVIDVFTNQPFDTAKAGGSWRRTGIGAENQTR